MRPGYAAGEVEAVLLVAFAPVGGDLRDSAVDRVLDFFHADEFGLELDVFGREGLYGLHLDNELARVAAHRLHGQLVDKTGQMRRLRDL